MDYGLLKFKISIKATFHPLEGVVMTIQRYRRSTGSKEETIDEFKARCESQLEVAKGKMNLNYQDLTMWITSEGGAVPTRDSLEHVV